MRSLRPRAVCVSQDATVRRVVGDVLTGAGVTVEFADAFDEIAPFGAGEVALVVVDRAARQAAGAALAAASAPVVVVGDRLDDDNLITLMLTAPVSHVIGDLRDRDLAVTGEKLVSGDLFGLEKYVAAGTRIGEREIHGDADKRTAISALCAWAEAVGARTPVVHRLHSVVDELLMNALLDAPAARAARPVTLRWASDAHTIAISVSDAFGELSQRHLIDNVRRARSEGGRPVPVSDARGAGLGLYMVLANVAGLIINVEPGRRTEVVCLFDVARTAAARSLHVFATAS